MAKMGRYCKAYPVSRLRGFGGWRESAENARREKREVEGQQVESQRPLTDEDFLYVHENLTVTDGVYLDENIIFAEVTPEWRRYCSEELGFEVPADIPPDDSANEG